MKPYYIVNPIKVTWCSICGTDLTDLTDVPCTHLKLDYDKIKANIDKVISVKEKVQALIKYQYGDNSECFFLPDSVKHNLYCVKKVKESLNKTIKFWHKAWYTQREGTGNAAVSEYYNGVKAVQEQRVYSADILYKKYYK